jgi:hypothetical protein
MNEPRVTTKAELLAQITRDWAALNRLLDNLSETQWTTIKDAEGWAVKDHITHLIAWERSVVAFLTGRPRHEGLQIAAAVYASEDLENHAIFLRHQHDTVDQVQAALHTTHDELMRLIDPLSDADLHQPYAHFLPDGQDQGENRVALDVIYGNTAEHYREHQVWIEIMLGLRSETD